MPPPYTRGFIDNIQVSFKGSELANVVSVVNMIRKHCGAQCNVLAHCQLFTGFFQLAMLSIIICNR